MVKTEKDALKDVAKAYCQLHYLNLDIRSSRDYQNELRVCSEEVKKEIGILEEEINILKDLLSIK